MSKRAAGQQPKSGAKKAKADRDLTQRILDDISRSDKSFAAIKKELQQELTRNPLYLKDFNFIAYNTRFESILHFAAFKGNAAMTKFILEQGFDVNQRGKIYPGATPLYTAAKCGNIEAARALIDAKADVDTVDAAGFTVLFSVVAEKGDCNMVNLLLKEGAQVDKTKKHGITPLQCAAQFGNTKMLSLLLEWGADINKIHAPKAQTALDFVCDGMNSGYYASPIRHGNSHIWNNKSKKEEALILLLKHHVAINKTLTDKQFYIVIKVLTKAPLCVLKHIPHCPSPAKELLLIEHNNTNKQNVERAQQYIVEAALKGGEVGLVHLIMSYLSDTDLTVTPPGPAAIMIDEGGAAAGGSSCMGVGSSHLAAEYDVGG